MSPLTRDFLLLCVLMCLSMDNALGVRVRITNDLERNVDLTVHCKSGDDDLGVHVLRPKGSYSFKFGTNFFGGTLFFCSFRWDKNFRYYDVYKEQRDAFKGDYFDYFVKQAGPCMGGKCYNWNP